MRTHLAKGGDPGVIVGRPHRAETGADVAHAGQGRGEGGDDIDAGRGHQEGGDCQQPEKQDEISGRTPG